MFHLREIDVGEQVVAPYSYAPGGVEVRDDAALQFKCGISGIVCCGRVRFAFLIPPLWNVSRAQARDRLHTAKYFIQHVAPVAQHVDNNAAAFFFAIIPRRPLRRHHIAFKHPITKLAAHRKNLSEETQIA